jgi:hypothetical protein
VNERQTLEQTRSQVPGKVDELAEVVRGERSAEQTRPSGQVSELVVEEQERAPLSDFEPGF